MKSFCQNCGEKLNTSRICSNCGSENKQANEKRWIKKTIQLLAVVIIIGLASFIFKGKILSYYDDITEKWKDDFKLAFAEYEFAELAFEGEGGLEIHKQHIPEIEEIYSRTGFSEPDRTIFMCEMKIESECSWTNGYSKLTDNDLTRIPLIRAEWQERLNNCGKDESSFQKCEEYHKIMDEYPAQKCQDCDEKISKLYNVVSSIKDRDAASKLFGLVELLRQQQSFYDDKEFIKLPSLIFDQDYCIAAQNVQRMKIRNMSDAEVLKAVNEKKFSFGFITWRLKNDGIAINKKSILEGIDADGRFCFDTRSKHQVQLDDKLQAIDGNMVKINDYIAMLNGNLKLDLNTWQAYPKEHLK